MSVQAGSVCAVVVTYNRQDLLRRCLEAVLGQTRGPDAVLVIDNASTDGTPELVRGEFPQVELRTLALNQGSAGGFHEGMAWGVARGFDWLWVMDDDTIPRPDALERLLDADPVGAGLAAPSLLASKVLWTDGTMHPMNMPGFDFSDLTAFLAALEAGFLRLRFNTFPSLLVRGEAVARHGPPRKSFFLWSDDIDFTARILRHEPGYLVPASVAVHETPTAHSPWEGGPRFYYAVRNGLFVMRGDALRPKELLGWSFLIAEQIRRYLLHERWRPASLLVVARGLRDGLLRRVR